MKPQPQSCVVDEPDNQEDIKPDSIMVNKASSSCQYQGGDNMSYSEKEALKKLPKASSWPKFSGKGEYDLMELIDYIDGLFIDLPSILNYCITTRVNTAFKGHASIWYAEMKEIHGRRSWPWWKSQIIQKYSNGTWIWQRTMSFENDRYSVDKDPYAWCLRKSKMIKSIGTQMNIHMRNHKILTQMPGELEHAVKCGCNQNFTLYDIANTLPDGGLQKKPKEKMAEVTNKKNTFHNCGSTDHYSNSCPKEKKKFYAIEQVPEEESPKEDFESDSTGVAIREKSDDDQDPREGFLVEYQDKT
ncbi:hypothetical protein O181_016149 [Austropuccinia psidii MF-1]|uniref:Uncharacterized protein n=1 Tax=Austropuccinia psidii MF-1 TaxID=1389203 RepID=A0A9Q3C3A9_9BASI|nr:hypothetical protein [Austropuccinia psidii MF-1]